MLYLDIETRSGFNLFEGLAPYVADPEFDVICAVLYDSRTEEFFTYLNPRFIYPDDLELFPNRHVENFLDRITQAIDSNEAITAHNAAFERAACAAKWPRLRKGFLNLSWRCTMAKCYAAGLPPALKNAARALQIKNEKLESGSELISLYSVPNKKTGRLVSKIPGKALQSFIEYCKQDVVVTVAVDGRIPPSNDPGRRLNDTLAMNDRGLPINTALAKRVIETLAATKDRELSHLPINPNSRNELLAYCEGYGVILPNMTKQVVELTLLDPDLPAPVRAILLSRQSLGTSSTAKYLSAIQGSWKGRVVAGFQYNGAQTGRDGGRGFQPQNIPRGTQEAAELLPMIDSGLLSTLYGLSEHAVARDGLRSIVQSDKGFFCSDFANIETRKLLWITGDKNLDVIVQGRDLYIEMAATIYRVDYADITNRQRFVGKEAILSLGFQTGTGFDNKTGKELRGNRGVYRGLNKVFKAKNIDVDKETIIRTVDAYRSRFHRVVEAWAACATAFIRAMSGKPSTAVGCVFAAKGKNFMTIQLPSGRSIIYAYPRLVDGEYGEEIQYLCVKEPLVPAEERRKLAVIIQGATLYRTKLYGGKILQNIVQSSARDVLFEAYERLLDSGYNMLARFHDELLAERSASTQSLAEFEAIMRKPPSWASTLPIAVEGWEGNYYRKG